MTPGLPKVQLRILRLEPQPLIRTLNLPHSLILNCQRSPLYSPPRPPNRGEKHQSKISNPVPLEIIPNLPW